MTDTLIGHNQPDWAKQTTDRLTLEYETIAQEVSDILAKANECIPKNVETEAELGLVTKYVVDMRDLRGRVLALHEAEKAPFLRQGQACDHFFFGMRDRLVKAMAVIGERGNVYNRRKEAEERAERERIAREEATKARAAQEERDRLAREAAEAEAKAARARKAENIERLEGVAEQANIAANVAQVEAMLAVDQAAAAGTAALAPAADLVRTRYESGHMSTAGTVEYVEIVDAAKLDLEKLRPYIAQKELLAALKRWAKMTDFKQQMDGAVVEKRMGTVYR